MRNVIYFTFYRKGDNRIWLGLRDVLGTLEWVDGVESDVLMWDVEDGEPSSSGQHMTKTNTNGLWNDGYISSSYQPLCGKRE